MISMEMREGATLANFTVFRRRLRAGDVREGARFDGSDEAQTIRPQSSTQTHHAAQSARAYPLMSRVDDCDCGWLRPPAPARQRRQRPCPRCGDGARSAPRHRASPMRRPPTRGRHRPPCAGSGGAATGAERQTPRPLQGPLPTCDTHRAKASDAALRGRKNAYLRGARQDPRNGRCQRVQSWVVGGFFSHSQPPPRPESERLVGHVQCKEILPAYVCAHRGGRQRARCAVPEETRTAQPASGRPVRGRCGKRGGAAKRMAVAGPRKRSGTGRGRGSGTGNKLQQRRLRASALSEPVLARR